jgi:hypothetical protein
MTRRRITLAAIPIALVLVTSLALGQRFGGGGRRTAQIPEDRAGVPDWKVDEKFKNDVFTFVRIQYDDGGGYGGFGGRGRGGYGRGGRWLTDFPDSDLNFSYRLQQLTALKVNPVPVQLRLTDEKLFDYPFIYIIEPGNLEFHEDEVVALRRYLLNGGFLMIDDFWGDSALDNMLTQLKRVFPDRPAEEIPLDHAIFQCVYRLKEKPQIPNVDTAINGRSQGITWEWNHDGDTRTVHYKGIKDDKERIMVFICHNTDLGDGWEREGEDPWYFREFSEKKAYPLGINIVTYAMTH